jgi:hypothetical protein
LFDHSKYPNKNQQQLPGTKIPSTQKTTPTTIQNKTNQMNGLQIDCDYLIKILFFRLGPVSGTNNTCIVD